MTEYASTALERVVVVTDIPSPYQVELFNALAATNAFDLRVIYVRRTASERLWKVAPCTHQHGFLSKPQFAHEQADDWLRSGDLVVFSHYRSPLTRRLIGSRAHSKKPWCFWGERPGAGQWKVFGRWFRRWALRALHRQVVPIWGIGQWAIEGYRAEFGERRAYFNVPYFSDLERFSRPRHFANTGAVDSPRWLLYSGILCYRKGVDLLAEAFLKAARVHPNLGLILAGTGALEAELKRRLSALGERVRFLGFKAWDELPSVYASAHGLIAPSRYDGWGMIIPEGLAAGLPVIATQCMGAAIDMVNPSNGWVVAQGDVPALEQALDHFAALDEKQLQAMANAARHTVANHRLEDGVARFVEAARWTVAHHELATPCTSPT